MGASDPKDDDSSGISINELPDETPVDEQAEALRVRTEAFKAKKRWEKTHAQDQRAQTLAKLSPEDKLLAMTRQYEFDRKEPRFGLLLVCLIPVALKYGDVFHLIAEGFSTQGGAFNIAGGIMASIMENVSRLMQFAELMSAGLIFFFPPLRSTQQRFIVSFEGLEMPQRLQSRPSEGDLRVRIRWDQISEVKPVKTVIKGLRVYDLSHQVVGELRWDLWKKDKRSLLKLLGRYVGDQHPLRKLVEQELA